MHLGEAQTRIHVSDEQKLMLRQSFAEEINPSLDTLRSLSEAVGLSEQRIHKWFSNERNRRKKKEVEPFEESK